MLCNIHFYLLVATQMASDHDWRRLLLSMLLMLLSQVLLLLKWYLLHSICDCGIALMPLRKVYCPYLRNNLLLLLLCWQ